MNKQYLCCVGDVIEVKGVLYVVERTELNGGGVQLEMSGHYSQYPDGHRVYCRQLNDDRTYNSKGQVLDFWQTGFFTRMIENPRVVGRMKRVLTFTDFTPVSES